MFRRYQSRKIEIDLQAVSSTSPEVAQRLERIKDNYQLLDEIWNRVEKTLPPPASKEEAAEPELSTTTSKAVKVRQRRTARPKPR
ncbi:MAG: hypothetical protein ABL888_09940 [Pirellulaceae bacterium]